MLWTDLAIQTLREEQHPLLLRAGYKRGPEYTELGKRALSKITNIRKQESDFGRALGRCGVHATLAGPYFVAETESGGDVLVRGYNYAALLELAVSLPVAPVAPDSDVESAPEAFSTPGVKTIAQIANFTQLPVTSQLKSLVMLADGAMILLLLRGDHQMSEAKFAAFTGASIIRQATPEELRAKFGADAGSLGPVGVDVRIVADLALEGRRNLISGANQNDMHLRNVTPGRDFACEFADLRRANENDACVNGGPLTFHKAQVLKADEDILAAAVEQHHDADGLTLVAAIAPFQVLVAPLHPSHLEAGKQLSNALTESGFETLLDDRDVRPGVKFKDADLIGIPYRLNLGKKLAEGLIEAVTRSPRESEDVALAEVVAWLNEKQSRNTP